MSDDFDESCHSIAHLKIMWKFKIIQLLVERGLLAEWRISFLHGTDILLLNDVYKFKKDKIQEVSKWVFLITNDWKSLKPRKDSL